MEAYEILLYPEGVDPSIETIYKRELMLTMMMRAGDIASFGYGDVPSRIGTELMSGKIIYDSVFEHAGLIYTIMFEYFESLDSQDKRRIFSCIRDIYNLYGDEIANEFNKEDNHLDDILSSYLKLKVDLDTVSPEISEEVERLANMSEEEFAEEMEKEFGDDEEDEETSDELKAIAPDTSKYDPEYDIPDEKLYDKHDD